MNAVLARWNRLSSEDAAKEILPCCGSRRWAHGMAARRPFPDEASLLAASDETWRNLAEADWMEAFRSHPRIGESRAAASCTGSVCGMVGAGTARGRGCRRCGQDRSGGGEIGNTSNGLDISFIVCATGKSGPEILEILQRRLHNDKATELQEAAEQQRQITHIRLREMAFVMKRISVLTFWTPLRASRRRNVPVRLERQRGVRRVGACWLRRAPTRMAAAVNCYPMTKCFRLAFTVWRSTQPVILPRRRSTGCIRWSKLRFRCAMANRISTFRCC